jgi:Uma2 family endonuclease
MATMIESIEQPQGVTELENIADLLAALGGIAPERLPLQQPFGSATESDVVRLIESPRKRICELIDGVLVEKAIGFEESYLASLLVYLLNTFVVPRKLGIVTGEQGTILLWPGRVRIPDVAFFPHSRLLGHDLSKEPIPEIYPDLAVEILSRTNTKKEMLLKRQDYFQAGVRLVWEIDPATRTVEIFSSAVSPDLVLTSHETLTGGDVLPGFSMALEEFFTGLDSLTQSAPLQPDK